MAFPSRPSLLPRLPDAVANLPNPGERQNASFLLHLAGTSAWQTFSVLSLGLGILLVSAVVLVLRRGSIPQLAWSIASSIAAYLANASLCLVVYASSPGEASTRSGWFLTLALAGPMALELVWLLARKTRSLV